METAALKTILVVDDDAAVLRLTAMMLEQHGFTVIQAGSGFEGLERFSECRDQVDLILTDIVMPRMSGTELIENVQALKPAIPVLLMTGCAMESQAPRDVPVLQKPFTAELLVRAVNGCLSVRDNPRASKASR